MPSLQDSLLEYRRQLQRGDIQVAYRGLMDYLLSLRAHFQNNHPGYAVPGNIYFGYMDMTYFSIVPPALQDKKLKIAVVFLHEAFRFEVWLAAVNKQVQTHYWKLFKDSGWEQYRLVPSPRGADSILESVLVAEPDFNDLDALSRRIETGTLQFITDVESFLSGD